MISAFATGQVCCMFTIGLGVQFIRSANISVPIKGNIFALCLVKQRSHSRPVGAIPVHEDFTVEERYKGSKQDLAERNIKA